jgi:signal transduction histidine kinase
MADKTRPLDVAAAVARPRALVDEVFVVGDVGPGGDRRSTSGRGRAVTLPGGEELNEIQWSLRRAVDSAAEARAATRSFLDGSVGLGPEQAILLVVTELVSNAVQHGKEPIELRLSLSTSGVRIEVDDAEPRLAILRRPGDRDTSGRGLVIVDRLGRWGCAPREGSGKTVWCDVDVEGSARSR